MAEEVWERANQTRADGWGEWVGRVGSLVDVWGDGDPRKLPEGCLTLGERSSGYLWRGRWASSSRTRSLTGEWSVDAGCQVQAGGKDDLTWLVVGRHEYVAEI